MFAGLVYANPYLGRLKKYIYIYIYRAHLTSVLIGKDHILDS